jgi:hypothetical protein
MCGPKMQLEDHIHIPKNERECEGMNAHIPKWTPTLGVMKFQMFIGQFKGQNLLDEDFIIPLEIF